MMPRSRHSTLIVTLTYTFVRLQVNYARVVGVCSDIAREVELSKAHKLLEAFCREIYLLSGRVQSHFGPTTLCCSMSKFSLSAIFIVIIPGFSWYASYTNEENQFSIRTPVAVEQVSRSAIYL